MLCPYLRVCVFSREVRCLGDLRYVTVQQAEKQQPHTSKHFTLLTSWSRVISDDSEKSQDYTISLEPHLRP